jgi:hypothetical protein
MATNGDGSIISFVSIAGDEHLAVWYRSRCVLPIRFSAGPRRFLRGHAPLLGAYTRKVLAEVGLADEELDELETEGVTGTAPAMARTQSARRARPGFMAGG